MILFQKDFCFGDTGSGVWSFKQIASFYPIFHKWSQCKFSRRNLEKVSCPISSPRQKLSITKGSRKKCPIVKEESCLIFLSTPSCFCSSVSDGSYLMVWMTLRLLCMPAQIKQTMSFTQIMDIWRPGRSMEDHLKWKLNFKVIYHWLHITLLISYYTSLDNNTLALLSSRCIHTKLRYICEWTHCYLYYTILYFLLIYLQENILYIICKEYL